MNDYDTGPSPEKHKLAKRAIALLATAAFGLVGCSKPVSAEHENPSTSPSPTSSQRYTPPQAPTPETTPRPEKTAYEKLPDSIQTAFDKATLVNTCKIKTSKEEMAESYLDITSQEKYSKLSLEELIDEADTVGADLVEARENLNVPTLPKGFAELVKDAEGSQTLPIGKYEAVVEQFFTDNYGLETYFGPGSWEPEADESGASLDIISQTARPTKKGEKTDRQYVVDILRAYAQMDKGLLKNQTGIAFGAVTTQMDGKGYAVAGVTYAYENDKGHLKTVVIYDVRKRPDVFIDNVAGVVLHETQHASMPCGDSSITEKGFGDPAFESFNPKDFIYGNKARQNIERTSKTPDGKYTVLNNAVPGKKVAFASPEGASNRWDDNAEMFQALFNGYFTSVRPYLQETNNTTIVDMKAALSMARMKKISPQTATYTGAMGETDKLSYYLVELVQKAEEKDPKSTIVNRGYAALNALNLVRYPESA